MNTWQSPDMPAIESKPKALERKSFSRDGSVFSLGGGPGSVGRTRAPLSYSHGDGNEENVKSLRGTEGNRPIKEADENWIYKHEV